MRAAAVAAAVAAWCAGCGTAARARAAQKRLAGITNDVAVAAAPVDVNLTGRELKDFVWFALTNRPSVETARLAVSNAVLALRDASSGRYLQLELAGGYSQATANRGSHFSWRQNRGKGNADFTFDLLLTDFGRIRAQEREARESLVAAVRDLADAELGVFEDVTVSYFTLLRNDALLEVARTNEFQYAEHLKQAEDLLEAGETQKLDVLKARVDLSDARLETINASNEVVTAEAGFLRALGLPSARVSRADVRAVAADSLNAAVRELPPTRYGAAAGLDLARTNAPSLMALRARLRATSADVDYAVADLLPRLSLSSAFDFTDPAWNWSWGVRGVQTLLDGWRKRNAVDRAVVAMETARTAVTDAEQTLSRDLAVAAATRDNARQSLETARVEVDQARENLQTVIEQYRLGAASRIDFTDAAGGFASALGARVKAFYAGQIAEAALVRLTGVLPPAFVRPAPSRPNLSPNKPKNTKKRN